MVKLGELLADLGKLIVGKGDNSDPHMLLT